MRQGGEGVLDRDSMRRRGEDLACMGLLQIKIRSMLHGQ